MSEPVFKVYLVKNKPETAQQLRELLDGTAYELLETDLQSDEIAAAGPGVMVMDCTAGNLDELSRVVYTRRLPVIALTRMEEGEAALDRGAWDYLIRDTLTRDSLLRSLRYLFHQHQLAAQLEGSIAELLASETRFHNVISRNSDGMIVVDTEGVIRFANPAATILFGRRSEDLLNSLLGFPVSVGEITELEILQRGSEVTTVEMRVEETEWENETAYLLSLRDITQRKRTEQALGQAIKRNYQLAAAIASVNIGVVITDPSLPDNPVIFANSGFFMITGYSPEEVIGQNCRFLKGPDTDRRVLAQLRRAVAEQRPFTGILINYRKEGTPFWNELTISPVFDDDGQLINFVGLQNNVTLRKQAEQALLERERLQVALEKEKELGSLKNNFMSTISHEFRTPLAMIFSASELLDRYFDNLSPEKRRERLYTIKTQVKQLEEMLDEIAIILRAEVSRLDFNPVEVEVGQFCHTLVEEIQTTIGAQHHLILKTTQQPLTVQADPKLLRHILINLLSNAVKYSLPHTDIRLDLFPQNGHVVFRVQDHGIGIPKTEQTRLFEAFYRASNAEAIGGTGLGLKIVKDCVTLHGGTVVVESELGQGTTCIVRLPQRL